jgi:hypothetical protein
MGRLQAGFVEYMRRAGLATGDGGRHPRCSPEQWRETRLAWFFGAWHLFNVIEGGVSTDPEVTGEEMNLMAELYNEMRVFVDGVATGRN